MNKAAFSKYINLSLICADPLSLAADLDLMWSEGLRKVHLDVMDSMFVPRFGLYPEISRDISNRYDFELDAHFMASNVLSALKEWFKYHIPKKISFHYEANRQSIPLISEYIVGHGSDPVIAYDLAMSADEFTRSIELHQPVGVMLLGIKPGVLVQTHQPNVVIERLEILKGMRPEFLKHIMVDGGVSFETLRIFRDLGATDLVCGSSTIYKSVDFSDPHNKNRAIIRNIERIRSLLQDV